MKQNNSVMSYEKTDFWSTLLQLYVVLCNYIRGDPGLRGITARLHQKGSCVLHEYTQEIRNTFVYWAVKKLNEKSF